MFKRLKRYKHEDLQDAWLASASFEQIRTQDLIKTLLVGSLEDPEHYSATSVLHGLADHLDANGIIPMNEAQAYLAALNKLDDEAAAQFIEQENNYDHE